MSGVWMFKENGVIHLVENPAAESANGRQSNNARRKVLVHTPTDEVVTSYASLEGKLAGLGWERYYDDPQLLQFHKQSSVHLISLPKDFAKFNSVHMYDIVVKNRNEFRVKDM
ncbi:flowering-promoting factor 1-like protein 1 [Tasmannia lanceolata]|uniref:flowering-promoting factor 1-like protein 1 n=1 Tax=Tasmannia lanceolata TaxID=3420 RepID=UPI004063CDF4